MRHLIGSLLAIGIASIATIAATTALLNAPLRVAPPPTTSAGTTAPQGSTSAPDAKPAVPESGKPATPGGNPDGAKPAPGTAAGGAAAGEKPEEDDQDPYEGIAPEELPPDLQYSADSSVSFPTNI